MSLFSWKKFSLSNSAPANEQSIQQLPLASRQLPPELQSHPPQQQQQPRPIYLWSVHHLNILPPTLLSKNAPQPGPRPSPFPRYGHALSATATAAGEFFLFGGNSALNDLYMFSAQDLSITFLQTSGEVPSPRVRPASARFDTFLLIWGGATNIGDQVPNKPEDDSLYLLNLVSRKWSRVVVNGPRPVGRYGHAVTMVGSKLFVFGGHFDGEVFNDMWAFDVNSLKSNLVWDSYELESGDEKPPPRTGHVLVTTGDRIILFGGVDRQCHYNDTWLFDVSTRKWTELQCTGYLPSPREGHAAAIIDDVMYVLGGYRGYGDGLGDLSAFEMSTRRWFKFDNTGPRPSRRWGHAMASDGTRVFVLGGVSSAIARRDETALIHVLDTKHIKYPNPDTGAVKPSGKTTQLARKSSAGHPTQEQPHPQTSYSLDTHAPVASLGDFLLQNATLGKPGHPALPQIARERIPGPNSLPSQPTGVNGEPRCVPEEDGDAECSAEYRATFAVPGTFSEGEVARLERERLVELLTQLLATLTAQTKRNQRPTHLKDTKPDQLLLSRDQTQSDLQKATSGAADADERSHWQRACERIGKYESELADIRAELEAFRLRFTDAENGRAKCKTEAETLRALTTAAGLFSTSTGDDRITGGLVELIRQAVEARLSEKGSEAMQSTNEAAG